MQADDPPPSNAIPRSAPHALWTIAQHFFHVLWTLFGNPEDLARRHTLTKKDYKLALSWLRVAEALMRRLLLIEAAALDLPEQRKAQGKPRLRTRRLISFSEDNPEAWRVSLRCAGANVDRRRPRRPAPAHAGETPAVDRRFHSAWPLAERYEALVRAFNNPVPFARRLARRVKAAPQRLDTLLRAPPEAQRRIDDFDLFGAEAEHRWQPRLCIDTS
jgi:hypothetical protein